MNEHEKKALQYLLESKRHFDVFLYGGDEFKNVQLTKFNEETIIIDYNKSTDLQICVGAARIEQEDIKEISMFGALPRCLR